MTIEYEVENTMSHGSTEFRDFAIPNTVLRGQVGSGLHGVTISNQDDRDEMGVCIEPPEWALPVTGNGQPVFELYQFRTQPEGVRSGPGDVDLVVYSLRKWASLAAQGNPTVLLLLFIPENEIVTNTFVGRDIQAHPERFLSRQAAFRFWGYMNSQREQMLGLRGKRHTNRPELVDVHGFDCYLDDTQFLTRRGWLTYDEVQDDDLLGTVNQVTGQLEFQQATERVEKPYSGPILSSNTFNSAWAVTPNHRMWVSKMQRGNNGENPRAYNPDRAFWSFLPASDVTRLDWHQRVTCAPRDSEFPVSDAHLALVGAFVSEGTVSKRLTNGDASQIRIEQKTGGRLFETMATAAEEYEFRTYHYPEKRPVTIWTLANRAVALELSKTCGEGSSNKRLPEWTLDLSSRQADLLLTSLLNGDGTPYRSGGWVYYTNSPRLADDVQALAVAAGRRANIMGPYDHGLYHVKVHDAGISEFAAFRGRDVKTEDVVDRRIVCFTVPNETLVTRRNGKVAMHGNTKFAYHMVRLGIQGVEMLTTGRVTLPMAEPDRTWLRELREGKHTKEEALERAADLEAQLEVLAKTSDLPGKVDRPQLSRWVADTYQEWWEFQGYDQSRAW